MARNAYVKTVDGWEQIATSVSAAAQGLAPIVPSSVTGATVDSGGKVSFSGSAAVTINNAFPAGYTKFLVIINLTASAGGNVLTQFTNGGTASAVSYTYKNLYSDWGASGASAIGASNTTSFASLYSTSASGVASAQLNIQDVNLARISHWNIQQVNSTAVASSAGYHDVATAYDGIKFAPTSGTLSGSVQIYGYSALAAPLDIPQPSPNYIINGAFDFWQRGTSFANPVTTASFNADRWIGFRASTVTGMTVSRQTASALTGIQYACRVQRNSGNTSANNIYLVANTIETVNAIPLQGKRMTLSFYARAGANYSGGSTFTATATSGTGTDQNIVSFTGSVNFIQGTTPLTTSWQRFTYTGTFPTNGTEAKVEFAYTPSGTASTNDWFEVTGVQLEEGALATDFRRAGVTYTGEQQACFRYYYRAVAESAYGWFGQMHMASNVLGLLPIIVPVNMRTIPSTLDATAIGTFQYFGATGVISSFTLSTDGSNSRQITINVNGSGFAGAGSGFIRANNNAAAFIGVSAEL